MHRLAYRLYLLFSYFGGFGLLLLGVLDSSFLFLPLGNDLLLVALTAQHRNRWPYYVLMSAAGSILGCLAMDVVSRKGGEKGLKKRLSPRRFEYVKRRIAKRAGVALVVGSLAPPPFPFTAVVAAAAAFDYPRLKLLGAIAAGRVARFTIVALLALWFGPGIVELASKPAVESAMVVFTAICVIGSGVSIFQWIRRSDARAR